MGRRRRAAALVGLVVVVTSCSTGSSTDLTAPAPTSTDQTPSTTTPADPNPTTESTAADQRPDGLIQIDKPVDVLPGEVLGLRYGLVIGDSAAWDPAGSRVAVPTATGTYVFDLTDFATPPMILTSIDSVTSVAFSPSGRRLAVGNASAIHVWNLEGGKHQVGWSQPVHRLAWLDDDHIVFCGLDSAGLLSIADGVVWERPVTVELYSSHAPIAVDAASGHVAVASGAKVELVDGLTGQAVAVSEPQSAPIIGLEMNDSIVVGSGTSTTVWDAATLQPLATTSVVGVPRLTETAVFIHGEETYRWRTEQREAGIDPQLVSGGDLFVRSIVDGDRVVAITGTGDDVVARIGDDGTLTTEQALGAVNWADGSAGKVLTITGQTATLVDLATGARTDNSNGPSAVRSFDRASVAPGGAQLLLYGWEGGVRLVDVEGGVDDRLEEGGEAFTDWYATFDPRGGAFFVFNYNDISRYDYPGVDEAPDGFARSWGERYSIVDGYLAVTANEFGTANNECAGVIDTNTLALEATVPTPSNEPAMFTPDGSTVVTLQLGFLRAYDRTTLTVSDRCAPGSPRWTTGIGETDAEAVGITGDGRILVKSGQQLIAIDSYNGEELGRVDTDAPLSGTVHLHPSGELFIADSPSVDRKRSMVVASVETGEIVAVIPIGSLTSTTASFDPTGQYLAVISGSGAELHLVEWETFLASAG